MPFSYHFMKLRRHGELALLVWPSRTTNISVITATGSLRCLKAPRDDDDSLKFSKIIDNRYARDGRLLRIIRSGLIGCFMLNPSVLLSAKPKTLHTPGVHTVHDVRQQLIYVTQKILQTEYALILANESIKVGKERETKALGSINQQQARMGHVFQNLRHIQEAPPLLMALTSPSTNDLVKSMMLLQNIAPQLNKKYKMHLDDMNKLSNIRNENKKAIEIRNQHEAKLQELSQMQEDLLNQKYRIYFNASKNPNLEKLVSTQNKNISANSTLKHFDDLVHQIETLLSTSTAQSTREFSLLLPVNGRLRPTLQKGDLPDLTVQYEVASNAQVMSPLEASVVFVGFVPDFGQVIILKQDDFFCVITGLGVVNCFLGDTLLPGEPIGRMPYKSDTAAPHCLRIELHKGGQHLDPRPYIKSGETRVT